MFCVKLPLIYYSLYHPLKLFQSWLCYSWISGHGHVLSPGINEPCPLVVFGYTTPTNKDIRFDCCYFLFQTSFILYFHCYKILFVFWCTNSRNSYTSYGKILFYQNSNFILYRNALICHYLYHKKASGFLFQMLSFSILNLKQIAMCSWSCQI